MSRRIIPPAEDPHLMEKVFRYVNACDRRNWRPVFTLEQFRAIYQAVMADPSIPNTDALPSDRTRVTLYGVAITVSSAPRPPMPEEMLDRDSPIEESETQALERLAEVRAFADRVYEENLADPLVQARRMYGDPRGSFEAHDFPPRSM